MALDAYSKWIQNRVKVFFLPYKREEPLYPQPVYDLEDDHLSHGRMSSKQPAPGESEVVPMACLKNTKAENIKL